MVRGFAAHYCGKAVPFRDSENSWFLFRSLGPDAYGIGPQRSIKERGKGFATVSQMLTAIMGGTAPNAINSLIRIHPSRYPSISSVGLVRSNLPIRKPAAGQTT